MQTNPNTSVVTACNRSEQFFEEYMGRKYRGSASIEGEEVQKLICSDRGKPRGSYRKHPLSPINH